VSSVLPPEPWPNILSFAYFCENQNVFKNSHVTLSKNEKSCQVSYLPCKSQAIVIWSCNSPGCDGILIEFQGLFSSSYISTFLASHIKSRDSNQNESKKSFSPPLNHSTCIRLNRWFLFLLTLLPSYSLPPHAHTGQRIISWYVRSCTIGKLV
jgi:hypothetical protein